MPSSTSRSLRDGLAKESRFADLEFAFDAGGMIHAAMNEGKSTPISIRVTGKNQETAHQVAAAIRERVAAIDGVVDARVIQRLNYPEYMINVDRKKAADLGLTQEDVMRNVVAAMNSSIQFNKSNFWIDPINKNQYYVGVQYREKDIKSVETLLNVPGDRPEADRPGAAAEPRLDREDQRPHRGHPPQHPADDRADDGRLGRDLGHVADDVTGPSTSSASRPATRPGSPTTRPRGQEDLARLEDRHQRRIPEDAGDLHRAGLPAWRWRRS